MEPVEFIGRCIDAARRSCVIETRGENFEALRLMANGYKMTNSQPLSFTALEYDFILEFQILSGMVICSAEILSEDRNYRATLCYSQHTSEILAHWDYCDNDNQSEEEDFSMMRLATNDFFEGRI